MNKTTIYYSVQNCGDGSAYPQFFYDKDVADAHQGLMEEGWGEDCVSYLTIEHEGETIKINDCQTREGFIAYLKNEIAFKKKHPSSPGSYGARQEKRYRDALELVTIE